MYYLTISIVLVRFYRVIHVYILSLSVYFYSCTVIVIVHVTIVMLIAPFSRSGYQ